MSEKNYKVHEVYIKSVDFKLLVIQLPEKDLEDRLTHLSKESGSITRSSYEDFIIGNCLANLNQLFYHLRIVNIELPAEILKVREEVVAGILKYNPKLKPSKLIINGNGVVKLKPKTLAEDDRILNKNKNWDSDYYDEMLNLYNQAQELDDIQEPELEEEAKVDLKAVDALDYVTQRQWWKRIGQYIDVKCFKPEDADSILKQRYFHNRTSFGTYIVSICVEGFEDLFSLLDDMGIPKRVAPPILLNELYEICRKVNPFLVFDNATTNDEEEPTCNQSMESGQENQSQMGSFFKGKKGKKKLFKDVSKEDLLNLATNMKVSIIGQNSAVDSIAEAVQRASVGLKDPNKPIGSFLFAGKSGCGKSLASKVLADELIRDRDNLVTIDCSEYTADHEYSKLIGSPNGYIGYEAGGMLTNSVTKNPFSVVVFDEVEKASSKVHELMLQILDEGRLTDGKGKTVSFKDTIIIMTSNIGVKEMGDVEKTIGFGEVNVLTEDKKGKALTSALKKKFKPEFLNRIDSTIFFKDLTDKDYMRIVDIELYKLNDNLKTNNTEYKTIELEFDKKVKKHVFTNGINTQYGARPLKRCIEKDIATPLALALLRSKDLDLKSKIYVSMRGSKPVFDIVPSEVSQIKQVNELGMMENGRL